MRNLGWRIQTTPQIESSIAWSIRALERLGRRAMMDFGFSAFLEKFEEFFGKPATRLLVAIIAIAIVIFCGSLAFNAVVAPIHRALLEYFRAAPDAGFIIPLVIIVSLAIYLATITVLNLFQLLWNAIERRIAAPKISKIRSVASEMEAILRDVDKADDTLSARINKALQDWADVNPKTDA